MKKAKRAPGGGRKPLPDEQRRTRRIMIRLTEAEAADLESWCESRGEAIADGIRWLIKNRPA